MISGDDLRKYKIFSLTRGIETQREIYLVTVQMLQQEKARVVLSKFCSFLQSEI